MKKMKLNPLELDKETISLLNEKQIQNVIGGGKTKPWTIITTILGGGGGGSTGCGSGGSQCAAQ